MGAVGLRVDGAPMDGRVVGEVVVVGSLVGVFVGTEVVGLDVVGSLVGALVGIEVVGSEVVGSIVGELVNGVVL